MPRNNKKNRGGNVGGASGSGKGQGKDNREGGSGKQPTKVPDFSDLECPLCHQKGHDPKLCPNKHAEATESSQAESSQEGQVQLGVA